MYLIVLYVALDESLCQMHKCCALLLILLPVST